LNIQLRHMLIDYEPSGKVDARIVVARAAERTDHKDDPAMGWSGHTDGLSTIVLPGDHISMTQKENAVHLAYFLKQTHIL